MSKVPTNDAKTIVNPFSDEFEPKGDRYIEKFQEVLYAHSEPTTTLLDSLKEQSQQTLGQLKNILQKVLDNAEPEHKIKFELAIQAIDKCLSAQGSL